MENKEMTYELPEGWISTSIKDITFYQKGKKLV